MHSAARAMHLLDMLEHERSVNVTEAAARLSVSPSSIRRDLVQLERQGFLTRVYGGAVAEDGADRAAELPRRARASEHAAEKRKIGKAAARLVGDDQTVLITGGSTTDMMLHHLGGRMRLTVVTNNLQTAIQAAENPDLTVVVVGGYLRREEMSLLGHLGAAALDRLSVDRAFFGAYAVDADGLMGAELRETETDRALIGAAAELIVLADASKFHRRGPARLAGASQIATLITDDGAPAGTLDALKNQGVQVICC